MRNTGLFTFHKSIFVMLLFLAKRQMPLRLENKNKIPYNEKINYDTNWGHRMLEVILLFVNNVCSEYIFFAMFQISTHKVIDKRKLLTALSVLAVCGGIFAPYFVNLLQWLLHNAHISSLLATNITNSLLNLPALYYFAPDNFKVNIFHGACCYYIWQACVFLTQGPGYLVIPYIGDRKTLLYIVSLLLLYPLYKIGTYLIKKIRPYEFSQYLKIEEKPYWKVCLIGISIMTLSFLIDMLQYISGIKSLYFLSLAIMLIAVSSVVMRITAEYIHKQEKDALTDLVISQQTMYIQNIEDIYGEMRTFKHDYLNMLSGLYIHAQKGNIAEIQDTVQNLLDDFDESIGHKMNMTNQLSNIKIIELKGLIIRKLTVIHQKKINFTLEVLYPVESVNMGNSDLTRCLGILLDNAVEEVEGHEGSIFMSILQERQGAVTFVIENTLHHPLEMGDIWNDGYSTKGKERGIGLSSYQHIVGKYENVTTASVLENDMFVQELRIGEKV